MATQRIREPVVSNNNFRRELQARLSILGTTQERNAALNLFVSSSVIPNPDNL